ncbi:hypothetical protein ACW9UR_01150 [Halovulum sp. GXIMD14794]
MKTAVLTAALLALAGTAGAECMWGSQKATTAQADMTPIPTAEAEQPKDPMLLLQGVTNDTDEG